MSDFISELKKLETDKLIYDLSEISIKMLTSNQCSRNLIFSALHFRKYQNLMSPLLAWDIPNIAFLSVKESNDYHHSNKASSIGHLVSLYRNYENAHSAAEAMKRTNSNGVFRILLGITAEQFEYQNPHWIFEKFNRDYYILLAAEGFKHRNEIATNLVIKETLGYYAYDYIAILLMVFWLCIQRPDPLAVPESLYCRKESSILTKENIINFVKYYSCTYQELRKHPLGKQLLYSKPFIRTQRSSSYLAVSAYLVAMLVGNGLYWLVRDYYLRRGTQQFVNAFGLLFEDYIEDLATKYCSASEWEKLSVSNKKGADYIFDFGSLKLLVESKSSLLKLDVKQQVPNLESADTFFNNTIKKAYCQLNSSYEQLKSTCNVPIMKIILLYDEFSNTSLIESSINEIFGQDSLCHVMTIRELEILLYIHHNDKPNEIRILEKLLESITPGNESKNLGTIYDELSIYENQHLSKDMDYFSKLTEYFGENLESN